MHRKLMFIIGAVIVAVAAVAGTAIALAGDAVPAPPATTVTSENVGPAAPTRPSAVAVDPALAQSFAVLTSAPAGTNDASPLAKQFGATAALARDAVTAEGSHLTVLPGNGAVCLVDKAQTTCNDIAQALEGYVIQATFCASDLPAGASRISGLVPNGVDQVIARTSKGDATVAVHDNVYTLQTVAAVRGVAWGDHSIAVPAPGAGATCDARQGA